MFQSEHIVKCSNRNIVLNVPVGTLEGFGWMRERKLPNMISVYHFMVMEVDLTSSTSHFSSG